jgi:aromatic ring-opening dioxygenase catalytic subunit (LigB family)
MAATHGSLPAFLRGLLADAGATPRAIVVVSAHWEEPAATVSARPDFSMLYDYGGFPEHTYRLQYPAPGSPAVAAEVAAALEGAGVPVATERVRGYDHGVFVPLMLVAPEGTIPVVPLSLVDGLDPAQHLAIGRALAPLRRDGVLIVGSGMSFHNLPAFFGRGDLRRAEPFDAWLNDAVAAEGPDRERRLIAWATAPEARFAHPTAEHLLPLMVVAGAADGDRGRNVYRDTVLGAATSGFRFG